LNHKDPENTKIISTNEDPEHHIRHYHNANMLTRCGVAVITLLKRAALRVKTHGSHTTEPA